MLPLEIWINIIKFLQKDILNLRLTDKYLLSVINKYCEIKLIKFKNYNFVLRNNKYNPNIVTKFINTLFTNDELLIKNKIKSLQNYKLTINDKFDFTNLNGQSKVIYLKSKNLINCNYNSLGDNWKFLKMKNVIFLNFLQDTCNKTHFENCEFNKGLSLNCFDSILKNCKIYRRFILRTRTINISESDLNDFFYENEFYNEENKLIRNYDPIFKDIRKGLSSIMTFGLIGVYEKDLSGFKFSIYFI